MKKKSDNNLFTYKALKEALEGRMPFHHNDDATIIAKLSQNKGFYELNCISPSERYDTKMKVAAKRKKPNQNLKKTLIKIWI